MQSFTQRLYIRDGFHPIFFFNRIYTANGTKYHVSVMDKYNESYFFIMENKDGSWKIINAPKLPDWIMNLEEQLEHAILEHIIEEPPKE